MVFGFGNPGISGFFWEFRLYAGSRVQGVFETRGFRDSSNELLDVDLVKLIDSELAGFSGMY